MNPRAVIALALLVAMFLVTFVARVVIHYRTTGSSGIVGLSGRPGSIEWMAGLLFELSLFIGAPASAVLELDEPSGATVSFETIVGGALMLTAIAGTTVAQATMGKSWRVGVSATEKTRLITHGIFGVVRNPIYTAMIIGIGGLVVLVPNTISIATLAALIVSLQLQVRIAEEPYLLTQHGSVYEEYAARVGRFVPGIGRRPRGRRSAIK